MKTPNCFISYCHDDIDRNLLNYLIFALKERNEEIRFYFDGDLDAGDNLEEFMAKTLDVDVALILLTPSYKRKVERRSGGVYGEFIQIVNRFWSQQKNTTENENKFKLIPVLLSGSYDDSVPGEIKNLIYADLVGFSVTRNKNDEFIVSEYIKRKFSSELKKITNQLTVTSSLKSDDYSERRDKYYNDFFVNVKTSEKTYREHPKFQEEIFVPITAFNRSQKQLSYFLVGRKGSGKSTIATALSNFDNNKYNGKINILADNIDLKTAYHSLKPKTLSDIESTLPPLSFFKYSWQGFLCLCVIKLLIDLNEQQKLTNSQISHMQPIISFYSSVLNNSKPDEIQGVFFGLSIERLQEFLELCIREARETDGSSFFHADIKIKFNFIEFLSFLIGEAATNALTEIVTNCQKRVLVTLDDFDTIFDTFRRAAEKHSRYARAQFEIDWLRSLLLLVVDIKDKNHNDHCFFRTLDFCLTIPKDRYSEIEQSDRDGFRYSRRTSHILWTGIELCEMLNKRLEKITGLVISDDAPHEKLNLLMENEFKELPQTISFEFNKKIITIPLFAYILRHTFWRPRDILIYYSCLLAAASTITNKAKEKVDNIIIRRIVSETTQQIIKTEFIDEYEPTIVNIQPIVDSFTNFKLSMNFDTLRSAIEHVPFIFSSKESPIHDLYQKIELLYDIGFIGVVLDKGKRELLNISCKQAFYFNEGSNALEAAKKMGFQDVQFVIHPIFSEKLLLDTTDQDFSLNIDWDYLYNNHTISTSTSSTI